MIRKQSTGPAFDQVSIRLTEAAHHNMNQKFCLLFKKTLIFDWLSMSILYAAFTY